MPCPPETLAPRCGNLLSGRALRFLVVVVAAVLGLLLQLLQQCEEGGVELNAAV